MSNRQDALLVIIARCASIRVSNGYQSDAGQIVLFGEGPVLPESDPDAAIRVVALKDTRTKKTAVQSIVTLPVEIQAHVRVGSADSGAVLEALIADIKRAIERDDTGNPDDVLGGTVVERGIEGGDTRPLDREPGSDFVGAAVEYRLTFPEVWGNP